MKIYYRILNISEQENSFVVRYYTDAITEDSLATSINSRGEILRSNGYPIRCRTDSNFNLMDNFTPTSNDIMTIVRSHAPIQWLTMQEKIANTSIVKNYTELKPLEGFEGYVDLSVPESKPITNPLSTQGFSTKTLSDEDIDVALDLANVTTGTKYVEIETPVLRNGTVAVRAAKRGADVTLVSNDVDGLVFAQNNATSENVIINLENVSPIQANLASYGANVYFIQVTQPLLHYLSKSIMNLPAGSKIVTINTTIPWIEPTSIQLSEDKLTAIYLWEI